MGMTGLRFGVVATLGALAACNGRYDVGSGEGGAAGEFAETGGSAGAGKGGTGGGTVNPGAGGTGADGGGTGGTSIDTGGTSGSGAAGTGTSGAPSECHGVAPESLPEYTPAAPEVVWQRISLFLYDEARDIDSELPEATTIEWVETLVESILDAHHEAGVGAPAGLANFVRAWASAGATPEIAAEWAAPLVAPLSFFGPSLFAPRESAPSRKSLLEDEVFLTTYPRASLRGAWMLKNLFCMEVGVPPAGSSQPAPGPGPSQTSRQSLEAHTSEPACLGCHSLIDPLGFSLEHYDENGTFREFDNGLPVDSSGVVNLSPYGDFVFDDNEQLLDQLSLNCTVSSCVSSAFLDYAIDQAYGGEGPVIMPVERQYVLARLYSEYHRLRPMVLAVVTTPSFLKE
jgi:hypothetical protein